MVTPRVLTRVSLYQAGVLIAATVCSLIFWREKSLAIFAGGLLMAANFWALRFVGARALQGPAKRLLWAMMLILKLAVVVGLLFVLVKVAKLDGMGIALGMATLFVGVGLAIAHGAFEAPNADGGSWDTV